MISASNLSFAYPGEPFVLEGVDFELQQGSLVGLVGTNGSGKSTLLSLLGGLYSPSSGILTVGEAVSPGMEKEIRKRARIVLQDADLQILGATVQEDMLIGRGKSEDILATAKSRADGFGLLKWWENPVQTLSWGNKRKLCIAAALMDEPKILLLDEPFSGLDYPGIKEMRRILEQGRSDGLTQIVASNDLEPLADMVDMLLVISGGKLVLSGKPTDVLDGISDYGVKPPFSWQAGLGVKPWDMNSGE